MNRPVMNGVGIGALLALATACADGAAGGDRELVIEAADPAAGLVATMSVDGERIVIDSVTRDGLRHTRVTGEDGTSYADWRMRVSDYNTEGSYGERPFGRSQDAESDGDAAAWAAVLDSRVGEVLAAVSAGAIAAAPDPSLAAVAGELRTLGQMHSSLALLGARAAPVATSSCGTGDGNTSLEANASFDPELGTCKYWKRARTFRPSGCTRGYYVQLYRIEGSFPGSYLAGDGTGDGPTGYAEVIHVGYGRGYYAWRSKHWDQLNPGYPVWRNTGRSC